MAKGEIFKGNQISYKDELTGTAIVRLTDASFNTQHPYFTQPLFSKDSKHLLVASDADKGVWQLFWLEIETGNMLQLTEDENISRGSALIDANKNIAYYWAADMLKSVNCCTLEEDSYYQLPKGFGGGALGITGDGQWIDFSYSEKLALSTLTNKIYSAMSETLYRHPSCVVMRVNTKDKSAKALWGEREWISHVITSPTDNNTVVFCHEGHWHLVQRTWVIKVDTQEVYPIVETKKYLERAGHEFFTRDGRIATQYGYRDTIKSPWRCADVFVNADGSNLQRFNYVPGEKPMHFQVNSDVTLGVADGAYMLGGPKDGGNYISLIKYEDGLAKQKILCIHGTSWVQQGCHPHPMFTPDDQHIIFDSDKTGTVGIFMAEANFNILK